MVKKKLFDPFVTQKFTIMLILVPRRLSLKFAHSIGLCRSWKRLKEKLPQAFMQIRWMEDDFRNLAAKVWANLYNPIKRYNFSKVSWILCMSSSSGGTLWISVTSQQYNCLMNCTPNFNKNLYFSWKYILHLFYT